MIRTAIISLPCLAACAAPQPRDEIPFDPDYRGAEIALLDQSLVQADVTMAGARDRLDVEDYALCNAAQFALSRGYRYARHLRTNIDEKGGVWSADAVYTISPSLPRGLRTIDAEVAVSECEENGIPTV